MGTRSIVAANIDGEIKGRYVHWDGYPHGVGRAVAYIVKHHGLRQAIKTLLVDHTTWSCVNAMTTQTQDYGIHVPGYGVAMDDVDQWYPVYEGGDAEDTEWAYVMTPEGIEVFQAVGSFPKRVWRYRDTFTPQYLIDNDPEREWM